MNSKLYLLIAALLLARTSFAQLPNELNVVWDLTVPQNNNSHFVTNSFAFLRDSSVAFLATGTNPTGYYFSKLDLAGHLLIDRQAIPLPSPRFNVVGFKATGTGNLAVLAIRDSVHGGFGSSYTTTDSAWLVEYDPGFHPVWAKYVVTGNPNLFLSAHINSFDAFETIDNGGFILNWQIDGSSRLPTTQGVILSLNAQGDPLYSFGTTARINGVEKVSNSNLYFTYQTETFGSIQSFMRTSLASSPSLEITNGAVVQTSNFIYLPARSVYLYVNGGDNGFAMQIRDSNLNAIGHIDYPGASDIFFIRVRLVKDAAGGLYAWNDMANWQNNTIGPFTPDDYYFGLARLDPTGKIMWSFRVDRPQTTLGGLITDFFPLAGNDFLAAVTRPSGVTLYRLSRNAEVLPASAGGAKAGGNSMLTDNGDASRGLSVTVGNNPSPDGFTIMMSGKKDQPILLTVSDASGKKVERKGRVNAVERLLIGASYKPGVYFLSVVQGQERRTVKLVKQ